MRRIAIAILAIFLAVALSAAILWRLAHIDLEAHIRALAGPQAVDCGFVPPHGSTFAADACALEQFRSSRPFWVRYGKAGIDSTIESVFMRSSNGSLLWVWYDSDVRRSGSRFFAKPRIFERACSGRVIEVSPGHQQFTCE